MCHWIKRNRQTRNEMIDKNSINALRLKHEIVGVSMALQTRVGDIHTLQLGDAIKHEASVQADTYFQVASLSKTVGSLFAMTYFESQGIALSAPVNALLDKAGATIRLKDDKFQSEVTLDHLMSHRALNMHYVQGIPLGEPMPRVRDLLDGDTDHGYPPVEVLSEPGSEFHYSGAGFLMLQHLLEELEGCNTTWLTKAFLEDLGSPAFTFDVTGAGLQVAHGYDDDNKMIKGTRKQFPEFAAGGLATPSGMLQILTHLGHAYQSKSGSGPISHETAMRMLSGRDLGSVEFMGAKIGLGTFVVRGGANKFMTHHGANDGFRALYLYCFDGPDAGMGWVIFANGDNNAMRFVAEATQVVLRKLKLEGIDTSKFKADCNINDVPEEAKVNIGYKSMIFSAFENGYKYKM